MMLSKAAMRMRRVSRAAITGGHLMGLKGVPPHRRNGGSRHDCNPVPDYFLLKCLFGPIDCIQKEDVAQSVEEQLSMLEVCVGRFAFRGIVAIQASVLLWKTGHAFILQLNVQSYRNIFYGYTVR